MKTRDEKDSMGMVQVPHDALYGASTQRAVENFPISGYLMPLPFIRSMGLLKYACAQANQELGKLSADKADKIKDVADRVYAGQLDDHFPVDVFQTGSATSSNMNINEVIANQISLDAGEPIGSKRPVHPNDDVNLGQSSNDTMPTALHMSVTMALKDTLLPSLKAMHSVLEQKSIEWKSLIKIGRTHMMDATPLTFGQEFSGYARQVAKGIYRVEKSIDTLRELTIGGTAVGTGINTHVEFPKNVILVINEKTGHTFIPAHNRFEQQAARDDCVEVAGQLITISASLMKIAQDIRLLGSGPRAGLSELAIPSIQPGSSIMPGKVNPVMSEMLIQTMLYINGLCTSVQQAGREGYFELNVSIPLVAYCLHESIRCMANASSTFTERCLMRLHVNEEQCKHLVDRSLMLVTALNSHIGYDKAAYVAKKAFQENRTLKEVMLEENLMPEDELDSALNPNLMTTAEL